MHERGNKRQTRSNSRRNLRKDDNSPTESEDTAKVSMLVEHEALEAVQAKLMAEIQAVRVDVSELVDFRGEISTKLNGISTELREITDRVEATEQRVAVDEESHGLQESIQAA